MSHRTQSLLAVLLATATLGLAISSATATRIAMNSRNIRATWSSLIFAGAAEMSCPVTIEGSFHSATISKVTGALIGFVSRATVARANCASFVGASAEVRQASLPWHIQYRGFTGTLPTANVVLGMSTPDFIALIFGVPRCEYRGTMVGSIALGGASTRITPDEPTAIPRISGTEELCGTSGAISNESNSITVLGGASLVTARLI